jgi:hypothetical protein
MPDRRSDARPTDETDGARNASHEASTPEAIRTLAAGRLFLTALARDLAALGRHFARSFRALTERKWRRPPAARRAGAPRRAAIGLARGVAVVALLGVLAFAGALVWALHDLPPERPVGEGSAPP